MVFMATRCKWQKSDASQNIYSSKLLRTIFNFKLNHLKRLKNIFFPTYNWLDPDPNPERY